MHFVGIGGIGMSGIAEVLHNLGYRVQGSDLADGANVRRLAELGIPVAIGHDAENLGAAEVVVDLLGGQGRQSRDRSPPAPAACRWCAAPRCWAS